MRRRRLPDSSATIAARRAAVVRDAGSHFVRRHPYQVLVAALVLGLVAAGATGGRVPVEAALLAGAGGGVLAALRAPFLGVACAALLLAGAAIGDARLAAIDAPAGSLGEGLRVEAQAVLLEHPRPSPFGWSAEIEVLEGPARGAHLLARGSQDVDLPAGAAPGSGLQVSGFAEPPEAEPGADFDWAAHLRRRGLAGELRLEAVEPGGAERGGLAGAVDGMRSRAEEALAAGVEPPEAALVRGMVLGQDGEIDALVRDDFRASGLAHLLAVSGQNVMLLGLLALPALAALGLGTRGRVVALLGLIVVYVPLAGAGPSLQRAGAMGAAGLLALALGRPASRWHALLLAAAVTLVLNPRSVGDPGWQLSFAAVVGILVLAPVIRRALRGLHRAAAEGVAITVSATIATAPLLAHHFDQVSVASLPANLLALPAVAPVMWIGMIQIAAGQLLAAAGPIALLGRVLATALGVVNDVLLRYLAWLARRFGELPWATVDLSVDSAGKVGIAYALTACGLLAAHRLGRRAGPRAAALGGTWRTAPREARAAAALAACALALLATAELTATDRPPDRLSVSFLDVGQGDATLVQHPEGGTILIDGGPVEARVYRLVRAAGVDRLDLVIATHRAADHHAGLHEVLERMPVELLLEGGDRTDDPDFRALIGEAERRGVRTVPARAGQVLEVGGLTVEVIWPEPRGPAPPPEDPNERAVTTVVSAGEFELLASGDAESPALAPLDLPDVDVLKVPHHGSDDPGLPLLLEQLRPEIAAIGVGADNGYGHPDPDTVTALEDAGSRVYRTDLDGTVTVTVGEEGLAVATER